MIEQCFTQLSTVFQSYHGNSSHYSCLSWLLPVLGWGSEVSCQMTLLQKTKTIQSCSNPGPQDYESNTLPLSHTGLPFNPLPNNTTFQHTKDIQLWKTLWEKEKLLVVSNFSFSHNVFYPIWYLFSILKCRLQFVSIWTSLKFSPFLSVFSVL